MFKLFLISIVHRAGPLRGCSAATCAAAARAAPAARASCSPTTCSTCCCCTTSASAGSAGRDRAPRCSAGSCARSSSWPGRRSGRSRSTRRSTAGSGGAPSRSSARSSSPCPGIEPLPVADPALRARARCACFRPGAFRRRALAMDAAIACSLASVVVTFLWGWMRGGSAYNAYYQLWRFLAALLVGAAAAVGHPQRRAT